jgi:SAM-dependent methyltransferase
VAEDLEALLDEQAAYYRDRAPEYDDWWHRRGMHDRGEAFKRRWDAEIAELVGVLDRFGPRGDVLEIAAGTGLWTVELARRAERVTAVDQSAETLAVNRRRLADAGLAGRVDHVVADVFDWRPPRRYDVVFFSFWLSHVPPARFDAFWSTVADALAPGGRVLLLDNARPDDADGSGVSVRRLADGREYRIVKLHWNAEELAERLAPAGWTIGGGSTEEFFTHAWGSRG